MEIDERYFRNVPTGHYFVNFYGSIDIIGKWLKQPIDRNPYINGLFYNAVKAIREGNDKDYCYFNSNDIVNYIPPPY